MSDFNLHKFFNKQYHNQAIKEDWDKLTPEEAFNDADDIIDLISTAYSYLPGGHSNYKDVSDVSKESGRGAEYEVTDLDADGDIDAVSVSKKKPSGEKFVATGHDGSSPAKRAVITHKIKKLKSPGYYVEVSGKIKDILLKAGVPQVTDEATIEKVLAGKDVTMNDDGSYVRSIGGTDHTKILLGRPLV